jgi:hypothetical protein
MFRLPFAIPSSRCSVSHSYCLRYSYTKNFKVTRRVVVERERNLSKSRGGKATSALFSLWHVQGYPSTTPLQYLLLHPIHVATCFLYMPDASISRVHSVNSHRTTKFLCRSPALAISSTRPDRYNKQYDGT